MEIYDWDKTDANNNSAPPDGWPENMLYSEVNDAARACLGAAARLYADQNGSLNSTGSASAYVVASNVQYSAVSDIPVLTFRANHASTGACTLNVDSTGVKDLKDSAGGALVAGSIAVGQLVSVRYDATSGYYRALSILPVPASTLSYTVADTNDWGTDPTTVSSALDALADRTTALQTGTTNHVLTYTGSAWEGQAPAAATATMERSARTSNTELGFADKGKLIDITSGTFSQTFAACATLASGWFCYIRNSGTGDITLDPSGSETIDGLTTFIMYPGEVRLIQCDGSALRSVVVTSFYRAYTATGTFTKPPGYTAFVVDGIGGGGGGGKGAGNYAGGGGGGGGRLIMRMQASVLSASETVTIGAGGTGGTSGAGTDGGSTSLGSFTLATGGKGGAATSGNGGGGGGGVAHQPASTSDNGAGLQGAIYAIGNNDGKNAEWGGGSGGAYTNDSPGTGKKGGSSIFGGGGGGGGAYNGDYDGGAGGASGSYTAGGGGAGGVDNGAAGNGADGNLWVCGSGGGGAGINASSQLGTAGTGGAPGGGGGGGAYAGGGGNGADGGRGELRIWGVI